MEPLIIKVDPEEAAEIQNLSILVGATKKLITDYIDTSNDENDVISDSFNSYHEIYVQREMNLNDAKRKLENKYISNDIKSQMKDWELIFHSAEIKVNFE